MFHKLRAQCDTSHLSEGPTYSGRSFYFGPTSSCCLFSSALLPGVGPRSRGHNANATQPHLPTSSKIFQYLQRSQDKSKDTNAPGDLSHGPVMQGAAPFGARHPSRWTHWLKQLRRKAASVRYQKANFVREDKEVPYTTRMICTHLCLLYLTSSTWGSRGRKCQKYWNLKGRKYDVPICLHDPKQPRAGCRNSLLTSQSSDISCSWHLFSRHLLLPASGFFLQIPSHLWLTSLMLAPLADWALSSRLLAAGFPDRTVPEDKGSGQTLEMRGLHLAHA